MMMLALLFYFSVREPVGNHWLGPKLVAKGEFFGVYGARGYGAYILNHVGINDMRASKVPSTGPIILGQQVVPPQDPAGVADDGSLAMVRYDGTFSLSATNREESPKWFPSLESLVVRGPFAAAFGRNAVIFRRGVPYCSIPNFRLSNCGLSSSTGSLFSIMDVKGGPEIVSVLVKGNKFTYRRVRLKIAGFAGLAGDDKLEELNGTTVVTRMNFTEGSVTTCYLTSINRVTGHCAKILKLDAESGSGLSVRETHCAHFAVPKTNEVLVEWHDGLYRLTLKL